MNLNELIEHWKYISPIIRVSQNAEEYYHLANCL